MRKRREKQEGWIKRSWREREEEQKEKGRLRQAEKRRERNGKGAE